MRVLLQVYIDVYLHEVLFHVLGDRRRAIVHDFLSAQLLPGLRADLLHQLVEVFRQLCHGVGGADRHIEMHHHRRFLLAVRLVEAALPHFHHVPLHGRFFLLLWRKVEALVFEETCGAT